MNETTVFVNLWDCRIIERYTMKSCRDIELKQC